MAMLVALTSAGSAIAVAVFLNGRWPEALAGTYDFHGVDVVILVDAAVFFISLFVVGAWIYRAHANLALVDTPPIDFTPGWAIGWFAVPIANLFKPFQAMKALWQVSHGEDPNSDETAPGLLWSWWLAWVATSISAFSSELSQANIYSYAATSASALCLFFIIHYITEAQPSLSIANTFK